MFFTTGSMVASSTLGALACGGHDLLAQTAASSPPATRPDSELAAAANACVAKGEACIAHCIMRLGGGDTSMGGCAEAAFEMHAVMVGLSTLATTGSKHLPAYAKMAMTVCKDCEAECRKHEVHAVCKECADACARTAAACVKYAV